MHAHPLKKPAEVAPRHPRYRNQPQEHGGSQCHESHGASENESVQKPQGCRFPPVFLGIGSVLLCLVVFISIHQRIACEPAPSVGQPARTGQTLTTYRVRENVLEAHLEKLAIGWSKARDSQSSLGCERNGEERQLWLGIKPILITKFILP